ncbi:TPA: conjugal transfer protein TraO [Pseudomonas putida]|uniref:conjugal transfer protein TraO n=1 Tax=Pseudomonas putida TaxID=303 RepID=UPI00236484F0|nr:conjugal transfer protein TraO [Pseudomonas putida]MDD2012261.1 conjugal transfer protein TraO [Pseudomonas putida]HDS1779040.1 conjugal transfer protein TraO [Pseudomonas putida]
MSTQADIGRQTKVTILAAAIAVAALGYAGYTWFNSRHQTSSNLGVITADGKGGATQESEAYRQVLEKYNHNNAKQAESNGQSYMSVMSTTQASPADASTKTGAGQQQQPQVNYYYQAAPQPQQPVERNKEMDKLVAQQVSAFMSGWTLKTHGTGTTTQEQAYSQSIKPASLTGVGGTAGSPGAAQTSNSRAAKAQDQVVVDGFFITPALLKTELDTDENSMVTAEVPGGRLAGARVFAMGYKRLNETIDMTFTYMEWKGRSYKITAKAVDPESMRTALSGEVNNRYFSRIILPALALAIGKTGQLYERSASENIITSEGAVIQTYPTTPSGKAVAGTFAGGIGQQAGQVLANDAANMPQKQVIRPINSTIGIQFVGPVLASDQLEKDALMANQKAELNTLGQPGGQPQQQYRLSPNAAGANNSNGFSGYQGVSPGYGQQYMGQPTIIDPTRY